MRRIGVNWILIDLSYRFMDTKWTKINRVIMMFRGTSSSFDCTRATAISWFSGQLEITICHTEIFRIFENHRVTTFFLMRNYHLSIPNWPNVPRASQSSAVSPSAWRLSCLSIIVADTVVSSRPWSSPKTGWSRENLVHTERSAFNVETCKLDGNRMNRCVVPTGTFNSSSPEIPWAEPVVPS